MRSPARRRLLALLVLVAGTVALWLALAPRGGEETGARGASHGVRAEAAVDPAPRAAPDEPAQVARESLPASEAAESSAAAPPAPADAPRPASLVEGVLRRALDGGPAAGVLLVFRDESDASQEATTDEGGRFALSGPSPGEIVRVARGGERDDAAPDRCPFENEILPHSFAVPAPGERAIELVFHEPDAWLDVQVLEQGRPAEARVSWSGRGFGFAVTDVAGRVRIPFCSLDEGRELEFGASAAELESARAKRVHPWSAEPLVLELRRVGRILVRVLDPRGSPVEGAFVRTEQQGRPAWTDRDGEAVLGGLLPGTWRVVVEEREAEALDVELEEGGVARVELVLESLPLLAAGRVVDEEGEPIAGASLALRCGDEWSRAETGRDGAFEAYSLSPRAAQVRIALGGGVEDERYDPERVEVPVGARDVVFRRLAPVAPVELFVALLDARTSQPLGRAVLVLHRGREHSVDSYNLRDGVLRCVLKPYGDVRAVARAIGYRDRELDWEALSAGVGSAEPLRVALEPGLDLRVRVLDVKTGAGIEGARILDGEEPLATTDAEGRAHLVGERWPAAARARAEGYRDATWGADEVPWQVEATFELRRVE